MLIKNLKLKNFKLFKEETNIPLSSINLLTGINGKGKSSVLQSFLLLKQSIDYDRTTDKIVLNHDDVKLGSFSDVKNIDTSPSESIDITFTINDFVVKYKLTFLQSDQMSTKISEIQCSYEGSVAPNNLLIKSDDHSTYTITGTNFPDELKTTLLDLFIPEIIFSVYQTQLEPWVRIQKNLGFSKVHYVSADRSGPKLYYEDKSLKGFFSVGASGQDTVNVLHHIGEETLNSEYLENLLNFFHIDIEEVGKTINQQAEFWFDQIFGGAKFKIQSVQDTNLLTFSVSPDGGTYHKSTNVGYGFTYVLPILIAGLISKPGEILIVENPEAHLHPSAQHIIAQFLTYVSQKGVQVIVESHSEHILNGLRISIYDDVITKDQLNVFYFTKSPDSLFKKIEIDEKGGISDWPTDFFDQSTRDLNYLFGV